MEKALDLVIRGDGITGCALALALAPLGLRMGLWARPAPAATRPDVRAYSLNAAARRLLEGLQAWPDAVHVGEVRRMAVWGDDGGDIEFAADPGQALSWIVDVPELETLLRARARSLSQLQWLNEPVAAELTVICEGRHSETRRDWGIEFDGQPYAQHALALRVWHEQPHQACARQWFKGSGGEASILALLPLSDGHQSAVVWSQPAHLAAQRQALDDAVLARELAWAMGNAMGDLRVISERAAWPLQSAQARHWSGRLADGGHFVLVGDAAHTIHPLAGLGLNLGLNDVAVLSRILSRRGNDPQRHVAGLHALLRQYERERKWGVGAVNAVCDGLQVLFAHPSGAARWLRNRGLRHVDGLNGLKKWIMARATQLETGL